MRKLSERERKIKNLLMDEFPELLSDSFEAEEIALKVGEVFEKHGEDFNERSLEADIVFVFNSNGKSVIGLEDGRELLDRIIEIF